MNAQERIELAAAEVSRGLTQSELSQWANLTPRPGDQDVTGRPWHLTRAQSDELFAAAQDFLKASLNVDPKLAFAVSLRRLDDLYGLAFSAGNLQVALGVEKCRLALLKGALSAGKPQPDSLDWIEGLARALPAPQEEKDNGETTQQTSRHAPRRRKVEPDAAAPAGQ
ncbi:MAG: hypothetical protein ABSE73_16590 [Planctomycetota bacterium]